MIKIRLRTLSGLLTLVSALAAPLGAQGANKQQTLEPHVSSQLWPTRPLSPVEQEFKERVVAMRDTVIAIQATVEHADRARRNRNTPAVLTSSTRAVGASCARVERNTIGLKAFSEGLTSNDAKFGVPAIERFRAAIDGLQRAMAQCQGDVDRLFTDAGTGAVDPDRVLKLLDAVRASIPPYTQAAQGLAKTLDIRIEATDKS